MNSFQIALDKYITSEPFDASFDSWCEKVIEHFTDLFYNENEEWIMAYDNRCNDWLNKLFNKEHEPEIAANLIERSFYFYNL